MKNYGSFLEFTDQRNNEIIETFNRILPTAPSILDAFAMVANSPASRFWVSEERAAIVIADMLRKRPLTNMRPLKMEMFNEIFRRFMIIRKDNPRKPIRAIVSQIVHQPAPSFYLSPRTIGEIIYLIHKGWYDRRSEKGTEENLDRKR